MKTQVIFIQGGGQGAHNEDAPLATSLQKALGSEYVVKYPTMPDEANPQAASWQQKISVEFAQAKQRIIAVGHSIGGSILLKCLIDRKIEKPIDALYLLAAPAWDGVHWNFDDLKLPGDLSQTLAQIPQISLYHCRDDEIVPFAHLAIHKRQIPQAKAYAVEKGGHQFAGDLTQVARDIRNNLRH